MTSGWSAADHGLRGCSPSPAMT